MLRAIVKIFSLLLLVMLPFNMKGSNAPLIWEMSGTVRDSLSGEPLPFVNIYINDTQRGSITSEKGKFSIKSKSPVKYIRVTSLGYNEKKIEIKAASTRRIDVRLSPSTTELADFVVKPKKQKYSKKNNPAVAFWEKLKSTQKRHNPHDSEFYSFDKYDKMTIGIVGFMNSDSTALKKKKWDFLLDYVDTVPTSKNRVLKVSLREKASSELHTNRPRTRKEIVRGTRSVGIDKSFNQQNIQEALQDIFREVDVFDNDITILQNRFVSPLSNIGANYYKFYIDTVVADSVKYIELSFAPHNPATMGFNGKIYVAAADTTFAIRHLEMRIPHSTNLNFVRDLFVRQTFDVDDNGNRRKLYDDMTVEFELIPATPVIYSRRQTSYRGHSYARRKDMENFYSRTGSRFILDGSDEREDMFWEAERNVPLSKAESSMGSMLLALRAKPLFYWGEKILSVIVEGYISTGKKSKFDFGPVNTLVSYNKAEGVRFRLGGMTTANFSKRLFARGYLAYGLRDEKFKYEAQLEYSFIDKKYHAREFPVNSLHAIYRYDVDMLGQHYLFTNADNIFLSLKRKESYLATYRRLAYLSYQREFANNLSFEIGLRHEIQEATRWVKFERHDGTFAPRFKQAAIQFKVRWAPGEKFIQARSNRMPLNMDAPIFQLAHEFGPKGILGADFTINKTELSIQKRTWFSAFGYLDAIVKAGKIWSQVQYPALAWQNANLSYTIQPESYSLMNPMEFAMDEYVSIDLTYWGNGILFNHIPWVKKLKLREVVGFKGLMGHLSRKNNPEYNDNLFRFPSDAHVSTLSSKPYMEISAGIDNIASILRVDYVWRLTYRNMPGIDKSGVRISLHFSF